MKLKSAVEIAGLVHIEYLPIMDYKNKSISLENVTSFDVNKSIQRSLTKALARHGLGLYLYTGEDLPEIDFEKSGWPRRPSCARSLIIKFRICALSCSLRKIQLLQNVVKNFDEPDKLYATLLKRYNVSSLKELTVKQRVEILEGLNELSKSREVQNGNKIHNTGSTKGQAKA